MTDLALRRATDQKQIDWLKTGKAAAQHLLVVINDILDISKIEADRIQLEDKAFSLGQLIHEALGMLETPGKLQGLSFSQTIGPALPDLLCGDAGVVSESGKGSTFWATVRLRRVASGQQSDVPETTLSSREMLARLLRAVVSWWQTTIL